MPAFEQGNLGGVNGAGMQVRAGDFDGNGREDVLVVNPQGEILSYFSVNDGTNNTFWWGFTTDRIVGGDDQITVARIDDNHTDDVVLRNRKTAETRFFRLEWADGLLPAITNVATGQMSGSANSLLLWGSMHGALDEPGAMNRDDAVIYEVDNGLYVRSDARWDGNTLTYWWAYTQIAPKNQFALQVERLHVDYQDDGTFGGGDEPYLIVVGFRSRFKTPNSTFTYWSGYLQDDWANGVDAGDEKDVPAPMGSFELPGISLTTIDDAASGRQFPELVGALVLAMESDRTPFRAIRDIINSNLRPAIEGELRRLIENGELDLAHLEGEELQQAIKTVETAAAVELWEKIGLWLSSFADPDDRIGKHLFAYLTAGPDLQGFVPSKQEPGLTFGTLQDQRFEINNNPVIFEGDGSKYQVTVSIKSDATTWVHQDPANCQLGITAVSKSFLPFISSTRGQGTTPATKTLRVLQYNVQFLTPWEGKPISADHWPNTTERATAIGKAIACYDVVSLNETVNPQRRQEILDAMNAEAPNCGKPDLIPGSSYFAVAEGPDVDGALPTNGSEAVSKLFANPGKPIMGDEVMIISRLPIIQTNAHSFSYSVNEDRLAAKGVLHVRLQGAEPFPTNPIDVFATHLQAGDANVRTCQVNELAEYIRTHTTPQNTVLLLGDFNIDGTASTQNDINSEYTYLNNTLTFLGNGHAFQDVGRYLTSGTNQSNDQNEHRKYRIDYILTSGPSVSVNQQDVKILEFPDPTGQKPSLSDHAAVEALVKAK